MADIIRDSSGARQKFGFGGEPGSAISSAPKLTNQWFLEFKTTDGKNAEEYSAYAKSVSPITIQTQTQPIDKYGRRIYVPTRVEFPEVSVSLYDKVDGSTMSFAQELYKRYFKNQDMNVDTGLANELNSTTNSGRKIVDADDAFRSFSSVTIYHWFGDQKNGGHAQRIVLVNPVITSITFSNSDYAVSEARVIDITLQPENVVFGAMETEAAIPNWMNLGISEEQQTNSFLYKLYTTCPISLGSIDSEAIIHSLKFSLVSSLYLLKLSSFAQRNNVPAPNPSLSIKGHSFSHSPSTNLYDFLLFSTQLFNNL